MKAKSNKQMRLLILGAILVCLFGESAHAQLITSQELWTYTHHGYNRDDFVKDVVHDPATGRVYLAGREMTYPNRYKYTVACLADSNGVQIWKYESGGTSSTDSCQANAVVVGTDGFVYSAGYYWGDTEGFRSYIVKHDPATGNAVQTWIYDKYPQFSRDDMLLDLEYGPDNKIYACGFSGFAGNEHLFIVFKLDTSLSTATEFYPPPAGGFHRGHAQSLAIDTDFNIWVGGYTYTSEGFHQYTIVKLDTSMNLQGSIYRYNGPGDGDDCCTDVALPWSGSGGIYSCGYSVGTVTGDDCTIIKLNLDATEDWVWTSDRLGEDRAQAVVNGPGNYTYAAGWITDTTGTDFAVVCLKFGLEWIWTLPNIGDDYAYDLELDAAGNWIYVSGFAVDPLGAGTEEDLIVTKHDAYHNTPHWIYYFDWNGDERAEDLDVSVDGNIYLGGRMEKNHSYSDFAALALNQTLPPTVPVLASPTNGTFLNDTSVFFVWHPSTGPEISVSGYYLAYTPDSMFTTYDSIWIWDADTTITLVLTDTTWYWRVKALDSHGNQGKWSDVWSFSFDFTAPDSPVLISPIGDTILLDTLVIFEWGTVTFKDGPPAPVRYVIQVDTDDAFPAPIVDDTSDVTTANYDLTGDVRYYWHVKAYDLASNEGSYSGADSFRVDVSGPLIDSTTVWTDTSYSGPFGIYAKVTDLSGVDSVVLMYCKPMEHPSWFSREMLEGSSDNIYFEEIPGVTMANDTVQYYIYARDNVGRTSFDPVGAPTDYYWFIGGYDLGVTEFDNPPTVFSFGLKSNPAKGKAMFNLALPGAAIVTLRIYDVTGRLLDKVTSGRKPAGYYEIPWSKDVSSGIFFYHLDSPWQQKIGKLVLLK